MPKPIFVVVVNHLMDEQQYGKLSQELQKKLDDYHVIVAADSHAPELKFQLFSDKNIEPIQLDELKELVLKSYADATGK